MWKPRTQMDTIRAVKADMERAKPMDRLVCGMSLRKDGSGVTRRIQGSHGWQAGSTALPTTILTQQHFTTFQERLRAFPVRVEMLQPLLFGG